MSVRAIGLYRVDRSLIGTAERSRRLRGCPPFCNHETPQTLAACWPGHRVGLFVFYRHAIHD